MPKTADEIFRDFVRFTGDGLPDAPVGKPLPRGDERSGVHNPSKADFREWANGFGETVNEYLDQAGEAIDRVDASIDRIDRTDQKGLWSNSLTTLQNDASYTLTPGSLDTVAVGDIIQTRREGYTYQVVASGGDHVTPGGVQLKAVWRGQSSDLLASGIDTTGAVDASPLLSAYLAARPGLVVTIPPGTYRMDSTVDVPSDTNLDLRNCTFNLSNLATGQPAFRTAGTQGAYVTMSARPVKGQSNIFLTSTAGLAPGDIIRVTTDALFDPARTNSKIGELARVKDVFSDRVTLHAPLMDDYTVGANGRVAKINPVRRVNIIGPAKFDGADRTNCKAIRIEKAVDCRISDIDFLHFDDRALWIQDCDNVNGDNLLFQDFDAPSTGYGISCIDATQNCRFTNITGRRVRHLFATNNTSASNGVPRNITVDGFMIDASALAEGGTGGDAMDTHAASENIHFWNGIIRNATASGINMEGAGGSIHNVKVYGAVAHGFYASNFSNRQGYISITDCETYDTGQSGIRVMAGAGLDWALVKISATVVRAGVFPVNMSGTDSKRSCDINLTVRDSAGTPMLYLTNGQDGHVNLRTSGQTDAANPVYMVRLTNPNGITFNVAGRMNNNNVGSRGVFIEEVSGSLRNVTGIVNIRNEQLAGIGVVVAAGGLNVKLDTAASNIDNFATATSGV